MKKLLLVLLAALLIVPATAETIDLYSMSYEELQMLQTRVYIALWSSEEMREVTVPAGTYEIGVDIPEGRWEIYPCKGRSVLICYGNAINSSATGIAKESTERVSEAIISPSHRSYEEGMATFWAITLTDGWYIDFSEDVIIRKPIERQFVFD